MNNDDYYTKLLKVYFLDNGISKKRQYELLNENPFNDHFASWEKTYHDSNRVLGRFLRKNGIKEHELTIDELTAIGDESIAKYLNDGLLHDFAYNKKRKKVCLVHDNLYGKASFLNELIKNKPHFILGICTKDKQAYKEKLLYYRNLLSKNENISILEGQEDGYNICVVKR